VSYVTHHRHFETKVYIPIVNGKIPLSWGWYVLLFFIIAGAANGVNLTDGVDGLAAGTGIIAVFTFTAMAVIAWIRSGAPGHRDQKYLDLAILGAALIGAIIGFLWYNAWPAEVFMGDTGAMAIGGALAAFAIVLKVEFLLLLIGGIFLIEALSVMIQVFSFRRFGKRVFLMAPIHHHFEMKAWSGTKIMVRFWILCAILCALVFGADSGLLAAELGRMGEDEDVIVLDESAERLEVLEDEVSDPRVWFMIGDAEVIPLPDGTVDEVVGADASPEVQRVTL